MLQEYTIVDMIPTLPKHILYYVCPFEKIDQTHLVWPHKRAFYSIIWFIEGQGFNVIDFTKYIISPNRLLLTSPEQIYNQSNLNNVRGYILMFDKVIAIQLGINFISSYVDIRTDNIPLLKLVVENTINSKSDSNFEIDLLYFYSLIVDKIERGNLNREKMNTIFKEFKEIILTNDLKILPISQYAETLHLPLTSLNEICRKFAGSSAKQFLLDIKIMEAKRLLIYSQLSISNIAYQLGFEDASYFARIFKKKTLLSPSSFLKKYRK